PLGDGWESLMTRIWLVRHGQASFGAEDYDRLSETGRAQSEALGAWFAARGVRFSRVIHGALRRQRETWEGIAEGLGGDAPAAEVEPGWDEYDADAIRDAWLAAGGEAAPAGDKRAHFRIFRRALAAWQAGELSPPEPFAAFEARAARALAAAAEGEGPVLAVSSGGTIGHVAAGLLGLEGSGAGEAMIRLNLQAKNTGFARIVGAPGRLWLNSWNEAPHLEDGRGEVTYA
ncbi:MAG: histidine phosphatase family protein, partial [Pseudomonadota bacterium]